MVEERSAQGRNPCSFVGRDFPDGIKTRAAPLGAALARSSLFSRGERSNAMQTLRDWFFPVSLFAAWTVTTAYTLALVSGAWVA